MRKIIVFDTTLRDGEQSPGFSMNVSEKVALLYWEHEGNRAIRIGRWKLVAKGRKGAWELYDLRVDRTELANLVEAEPERAERMAATWLEWANRTQVLPRP